MECDNISFSKTKHQQSNLIFGLVFAVIMASLLLAGECQAVTLTITANNGSVTATPDKADYDVGEVVELRPKPDTGYCFTGWSGDARGKSLVLNLTMDGNKSITANFDIWQPPIGIPEPEFGIFETYRMYDNPANRNPALTYTQNAEGGFYTHYADNTHPNATDTDNPYGTKEKPRKTVPKNLPEGAVVEVHNNMLDNGWNCFNATGVGSAEKPIFIRGVDDPNLTGNASSMVVGYYGDTQYIIVEGFILQHANVMGRETGTFQNNHMSVRSCEFTNPGSTGGVTMYNNKDGLYGSYIVFYNNSVHDFGDWTAYDEGDQDIGGLTVNNNIYYLWIVDNQFYHNQYDGVQIAGNYGGEGNAKPYDVHTPHHIYVGRNVFYENIQPGFWTKTARDVIFSQNVAYSHHHDTCWGACNAGGGSQYDPVRVWFLFNHLYDNHYGIRIASQQNGWRDETYMIGNLIYDCYGVSWDDEGGVEGPAGYADGIYINGLKDANDVPLIAFNTIYNCASGITNAYHSSNTEFNAFNNIIANCNHTYFNEDMDTTFGNRYIWLQASQTAQYCAMDYNLLHNSGGIRWDKDSQSLAEFQAGTDQGDNCIEADPLFVDAENNDFRLLSTSPAIDSGISSGVVQEVFDRFDELYGIDIRKDVEGKPRTGAWDIGAYEYVQGPSLFLSSTIGGSATNPGEGSFPYDDGTVVSIEATADEYYYFVNWTGTAVDAGKVANPNVASTTVTVDTAYTIRANFDTDLHTLTISSAGGGSVTNPGEGLFLYDDEVVPIQATADENYHFVNWTGSAVDAGQVANPNAASTTVTMDADYTLQANFAIEQRDLTITSTPGGTVTTPGEGVYSYYHGAAASVVAAPAANYQFVNWTGTAVGAGKVANANAASTTVTVDADYTIQANFAADQHTLTISSAGGGTVTDPGEGDFQYDHGTNIPIQATAGGSSYFVNWTGTAVAADKVANPYAAGTTVTVDAAYTIQANFGESDGIAPTVTNCKPAADSIQEPLNSLIILHVTDALGVAAGSVEITLDGDTIYTGDSSEYSSATGICRRIGTPTDFTYAYQSIQPFDFDEIKTVTVDAADLVGNVMTERSYSFITEMRSFGQNIRLDTTVQGINKAAPSTVQASNGNIWAVWHAGPSGSRNIYVAKLRADRSTFSASVRLTSSSADQANPAIALGTDDKLHVAWQDKRNGDWDIYASTSVDGANWTTQTRVNDPNEGNQTNPAIVVGSQSPNYAYIAWQDDHSGNQDIYITSSNDSFGTKTVSQITTNTANQTGPAIAVDSANTVYVLWVDARNATSDIYGAAGGTWTNVPIVTKAGSQSNPVIATESADTILHMLWVDEISGNSDIYYASSDGLPGSPLTGTNLIDDTLGKEQVSPSIAVVGSTGDDLGVFASWRDERNITDSSGDTDIYMVQTNSGVGTNVFVGDGDTNSDQIEPAISTDQYGYPYLIWTDYRTANKEIYFAGSVYLQSVPLESELIIASAGGTVGTAPSSITDEENVSVVVPAGACPYDATISITKIENQHEYGTLPFLNGYDFGPSGITFNTPVTVTVPYAVTGDDGTPTVYWYDSRAWYDPLSQQGITDIETIVITSSLHALRFKTTHFTPFYVVMGPEADTVADTATDTISISGGGGGGCSLSHSQDGSILEYFLPYGALALCMIILKRRDRRSIKRL